MTSRQAIDPPSRTPHGADTGTATGFRWVVVGLLSSITLINYLDRAAIGFAAPEIQRELGLDATSLGLMMGAFGLGYLLSNPVFGLLIDRRGVRTILTLTILMWAASMVGTALAYTLAGLATARVVLGIAEGGSFPAISGVVSRWLPVGQRGRALSLSLAAVPFSMAIGGPLLSNLVDAFGWRATYVVLAALTVPWAILWWLLYRDRPRASPFVNDAEASLIETATTGPDATRTAPGDAVSIDPKSVERGAAERAAGARAAALGGLREIVLNRTILANNWAVFVWSFYLFFFMSWLPEYLRSAHGVDLRTVGSFSLVAWGLATLTLWAVGRLSDTILTRTGRLRLARSAPVGLSLLVATLAMVPLVNGGGLVLAYAALTVAIAALMAGTAPLVAINVDLLPQRAALSHGIFTACLAGAGMLAPALTGWLHTLTNSFAAGFVLMGGLGLSGVVVVALAHRPDADLSPAGRDALASLR